MTRTTRSDLHVGFRNVQRGHLGNVDVAGRAPQVMIISLRLAILGARMGVVSKIEREALWHVRRPIRKPFDGIRRKRRGFDDTQCSSLVIGWREMAAIAIVLCWLLCLPVTVEANGVTVRFPVARDRLKGICFDLLDGFFADDSRWQWHCSPLIGEVTDRANITRSFFTCRRRRERGLDKRRSISEVPSAIKGEHALVQAMRKVSGKFPYESLARFRPGKLRVNIIRCRVR